MTRPLTFDQIAIMEFRYHRSDVFFINPKIPKQNIEWMGRRKDKKRQNICDRLKNKIKKINNRKFKPNNNLVLSSNPPQRDIKPPMHSKEQMKRWFDVTISTIPLEEKKQIKKLPRRDSQQESEKKQLSSIERNMRPGFDIKTFTVDFDLGSLGLVRRSDDDNDDDEIEEI